MVPICTEPALHWKTAINFPYVRGLKSLSNAFLNDELSSGCISREARRQTSVQFRTIGYGLSQTQCLERESQFKTRKRAGTALNLLTGIHRPP